MQMQMHGGAHLGQQSRLLQRNRRAFSSVVVRVQPGRMDPFSENAAQVKRLINRDRKEFLGNQDDILDKYQNEFGEPNFTSTDKAAATAAAPVATPAATATAPAPAQPASPFGAAAPSSNPFGAPASSNPFGAPTSAAQPFKKSSIEPAGLRPDMSPDPFTKEKGFNLLENITLTQIVLVFSFSLIIALMIATFYFVLSVGGVRLNGI